MDYGIFNMCTDVNACDCTRGCTDDVRESALKVDSGSKIPCGTEKLNLCWQHASPMLYQWSYIPTPKSVIMHIKVQLIFFFLFFTTVLSQWDWAFKNNY